MNIFDRNLLCASAAFRKPPRASAINQQVSHHPGGDGEKMCAALPIAFPLINEFQIGFIDEFARLEGNIRILPAQVTARSAFQLLVHNGQDSSQLPLVAVAPFNQVAGQFLCCGHLVLCKATKRYKLGNS